MPRTNRWALDCAILSMLMAMVLGTSAEGQTDKPKAEAGVAAYVGGKPITVAELDAKALGENIKLAQSLYDARREALNDMIIEQALSKEAEAQGTTLEALYQQRLAEKSTPVTDAEVEAFYKANQSRMGGQTLEALSGRIRQYLASQRTGQARQALLEDLKKTADVRVTLEPPRVKVAIADSDPVRGPADAKVTIVEYVDFQ